MRAQGSGFRVQGSARWLPLALLLAAASPLAAAEPLPEEVVRLKLRPQVVVRGEAATLADVLVFAPADETLRAAIGDQPVWPEVGANAGTAVTHEQIEQRLRALGVDIAHVLLEGAASCQIMWQRGDPAERPTGADTGAPARRPLASPDAAGSGQTLAQALQQRVSAELAELGGTAEVEFEQASRQFLDLTAPPFDFTLQPQGRGKLGLREFRVGIRRDGKTQRVASVFVRVRLSKDVVVANKPLSVGTFVQRDQLELQPRLFEREEDVGLDRIEEVVGQQVARFVTAGQMIRRGDLKPVALVQRSRPVSVVGVGRNVHVCLTGVALDGGGYGDTVRVRLGDTQKSRTILRGTVTGLGTVRVVEEGR